MTTGQPWRPDDYVTGGTLPPLAELVTAEDLAAARAAGQAAVEAAGPDADLEAVELRAQLEAFGARLLARDGSRPPAL
jgi:hypothetical protein